jgi:hypothetical protein
MGAVALHDGNYHDKDDWGSIAMELALGEGEPGLLECTYNCHKPQSLASYESQMQLSVSGGCSRFGRNIGLFYSGTVGNIPALINQATASKRLLVVLAGPAEILWQAKQQADPVHW